MAPNEGNSSHASPPPQAIATQVLPRSRLGTVSYRPYGSNFKVSANILNMQSFKLQRRDTGQIYYSVKEFQRSLDIEYGPGAAVGDFSPRSPPKPTTSRSITTNELIPFQKPLELKCGAILEHSNVWL